MPTAFHRLDDALDPLADLRHRFVERSRARVRLLADALAEEEPDLAAIAPVAHQLAGSAGTFGYIALGRAAAALEARVRAASGAHAWIDRDQRHAFVLALETALAEIDAVGSQAPEFDTKAPC